MLAVSRKGKEWRDAAKAKEALEDQREREEPRKARSILPWRK